MKVFVVQMLITIVIPVYNVEPYISDCLQSVMRQTYLGPLECILVDDCGMDKSIEVAEHLIAEYDGPVEFKVLHHDHNRGLSAARNTGLDAAKGDYVYFLDSDDWISDDCVEKLAKPLQNEVFDIVVGDYITVGKLPYQLELSLPEGSYHEKGISKTFCNQGVYVMAWNKLYSKEFLNKNRLRFEEGKVHEDEILAFEISCIEKSFYVVKSVTYYYRIRKNSIIMESDIVKKVDGFIGVLHSVESNLNYYVDLEGIWDYYFYWVKTVFGWLTNKVDLSSGVRNYVDRQVKGFIDIVPDVRCLRNKHNRLVYYACKNEQTFSRYQYVTQIYANRLQGRLLRNLLSILPTKV